METKLLEDIFSSLDNGKLIRQITPNTHFFYDEPRMYLYTGVFSHIQNVAKKNDVSGIGMIETAGMSFFSKSSALLKCLGEAVERICLHTYKDSEIVFQPPADISNYFTEKNIVEKIGWVPGFDLTKNSPTMIPAQLTSLHYLKNKKEHFISPIISTGAAFELDLTAALIKGLCEVIERDALMYIYLNKISLPQIDITTIPSKKIQELNNRFKRYKLKWFIFDFLNDFDIPVAISLLIDHSGAGPSVTVGSKCSFNQVNNIISSAEEAVLLRDTARKITSSFFSHGIKMPTTLKQNLFKRITLWWPTHMLKELDFLIKSRKVPFRKMFKNMNNKEELKLILKNLKKKNFNAYYKDITMDYFKKYGYFVIKAIIPELQPLYIGEKNRVINEKRLKTVADYYHVPFQLNKVAHPFL